MQRSKATAVFNPSKLSADESAHTVIAWVHENNAMQGTNFHVNSNKAMYRLDTLQKLPHVGSKCSDDLVIMMRHQCAFLTRHTDPKVKKPIDFFLEGILIVKRMPNGHELEMGAPWTPHWLPL